MVISRPFLGGVCLCQEDTGDILMVMLQAPAHTEELNRIIGLYPEHEALIKTGITQTWPEAVEGLGIGE